MQGGEIITAEQEATDTDSSSSPSQDSHTQWVKLRIHITPTGPGPQGDRGLVSSECYFVHLLQIDGETRRTYIGGPALYEMMHKSAYIQPRKQTTCPVHVTFRPNRELAGRFRRKLDDEGNVGSGRGRDTTGRFQVNVLRVVVCSLLLIIWRRIGKKRLGRQASRVLENGALEVRGSYQLQIGERV
jgi:hypothetical protein